MICEMISSWPAPNAMEVLLVSPLSKERQVILALELAEAFGALPQLATDDGEVEARFFFN